MNSVPNNPANDALPVWPPKGPLTEAGRRAFREAYKLLAQLGREAIAAEKAAAEQDTAQPAPEGER